MGGSSQRISVRLNERESALVSYISASLGVSTSEVVRIALSGLSERVPPGFEERMAAGPQEPSVASEISPHLDRVSAEICRVGVNVNQAVRAGHLHGWTGRDFERVCALPAQLDELDDFVRQEVGRVHHESPTI